MKRHEKGTGLGVAIARVAALNAILLLAMTVFRAVFVIVFAHHKDLRDTWAVVRAFAVGVNADLAVVVAIAVPVALSLVLFLATGVRKTVSSWSRGVRWYYLLALSLVATIQCIDLGYYGYFREHIDDSVFAVLGQDRDVVLAVIAGRYDVFALIGAFLLLLVAVYFLCRAFTSTGPVRRGERRILLSFGGAAAALVLSGAGVAPDVFFGRGFSSALDGEEVFREYFLNQASRNGILSLYRAETPGKKIIQAMGYEHSIGRAFADFLQVDERHLDRDYEKNLLRRTGTNRVAERVRPNVILVVMESFGAAPLEFQRPTFDLLGELKGHFDRDYLFTNFFALGTDTNEAFEVILLNLYKTRPWKAFKTTASWVLNSRYYDLSTFPFGAAVPYRRAGYATELIAMELPDAKTQTALGFDGVSLPGKRSPYKGLEMPFYDEDIFDHAFERLDKSGEKPKFMVVQTFSNHEPFHPPPASYQPLPLRLPKELTDKFVTRREREDLIRSFVTYQYANQKLGEFITRVKRSKHGNNTIIGVTGDHLFRGTFCSQDPPIFKVPFYLYIPDALRPRAVDTKVFGSHIDIMPTLYNLSLSGAEYSSLGNDLLDASEPHDVILMHSSIVLNRDYVVHCFPPYFIEKTATAGDHQEDERQLQSLIRRYKAAQAIKEYIVGNYRLSGAQQAVSRARAKATGKRPKDLRAPRNGLLSSLYRDLRSRARKPQTWAHRGYHKTAPENSMEAYREAMKRGAKGIELDIHYDRELARFVVSHDRPYTMPGGKLLFLEDVFGGLEGKVSYWLDYKNLSEDNAAPSLELLSGLLKKHRLYDRVYVEHWNAPLLERFARSGVRTLYSLPAFDKIPEDELGRIKKYLARSPHAGIAFPTGSPVRDSAPLSFLGRSAFAFTVNNRETLDAYMKIPQIRVILTDESFFEKR